MKKILFSLVFVFFLTPVIIYGVACPRGIINDPAPGSCGLYIDVNKDGYCDLSEPEESLNYDNKLSESNFIQNDLTKNSVEKKDHRMGLITIILIVAYITGLTAVHIKKISVISHRKLWNWLLLILFIPTLFTSLFLALMIEFSIVINVGIDVSFWHFIFGWAFLLVSVFHIIWHLNYYFRKNVVKTISN